MMCVSVLSLLVFGVIDLLVEVVSFFWGRWMFVLGLFVVYVRLKRWI